MTPKPGRIACLVPFCRRTGAAERFEGEEIICGRHWRAISREAKAVRARVNRCWNRTCARYEAIEAKQGALTPVQLLVVRGAFGRVQRAWGRCKREAIEAAGGIG